MKRILTLALAAGALTLGFSACGGRGGVPPNSLTALLRAIPQPADAAQLAFVSGDLSRARAQLPGVADDDLPEPVRSGVSATASPEFESALGFSMAAITSWIEVSPAGEPRTSTIVGNFNREAVIAHLRALGWQSRTIGISEIFTPIDATSRRVPGLRELTETTGGVGVAEKRIVFSESASAVERIAAYRGGGDSLLALPGAKQVATAAGSAAFTSTHAPSTGCPRALWLQVAFRYGETPSGTALVLQYGNAGEASAAATELRRTLAGQLPPSTRVGVIDTRGSQAVAVIDAQYPASHEILKATEPGGPLRDLPSC